MTATNKLPVSLFRRLRLVVDLATKGRHLLDPLRIDADGVQGLVLMDQAFELAMRAAADATQRIPAKKYFEDWLNLFPELQKKKIDLLAAHESRNGAQHAGVVPPRESWAPLRDDYLWAYEILLQLCGSGFDNFSSVPQVRSKLIREPLEAAIASVPNDVTVALSHVFTAFQVLHGWAADIIGQTTVPDKMWMFGSPLWQDVQWEYDLADNKPEVVRISLSVVAGHVLGINFAALLRLRRLFAKGGSIERRRDQGKSTEPWEKAVAPPPEDVTWAIETVARSAVQLEEEWPNEVLFADDKQEESS